MVTVPLEWTIRLKGGDEVRVTLDKLNSGYRGIKKGSEEYNKALAAGNREATRSLNVGRYQNNILLAQYPNLMKVSRAMSTVTSISRTLLTISNALNISKIAGNMADSGLIETQNLLNAALRERKELEAAGLEGSKAWLENEEEINLLTAQVQEKLKAINDQKFDGIVTAVESAILAVTSTMNLLIKNKTILSALTKAGSFFGGVFGGFFTWVSNGIIRVGTWIANALGLGSPVYAKSATAGLQNGTTFGLSFVGGFAAAIAGILTGALIGALSFPEIDRQLRQMFPGYAKYAEFRDTELKQKLDETFGVTPDMRKGLDEFDKSRDIFGGNGTVEPLVKKENIEEQASFFQPLIDLFTKGVPDAIKFLQDGFTKGWIAITEMTNVFGSNLVIGVNGIFSSLITSMNSAISAYNSAARKLGRSTIPLLTFTPNSFKSIPLPTVKAATGFDGMVNRPTMFLAGEAGPEQVTISPNGQSSGGNTIIINVAGSVVTEKRISQMVDQYQKQNLKSRGFTGFG